MIKDRLAYGFRCCLSLRGGIWRAFCISNREDVLQSIALADCLEPVSDRAFMSAVYREVGKLGKELDYPIFRNDRVRPVRGTCCFPGCRKSGLYPDKQDKSLSLCHSHEALIASRLKRGEGIEQAYRPVNYGPPRKNRKAWQILRLLISQEEWNALWYWAKYQKGHLMPTNLREILNEQIRQAVLSAIK